MFGHDGREADGPRLLDGRRHRERAPFPARRPDDLQSDREARRVQTRRDAGDGQTGHREQEGRRDPVHVRLHRPPPDRLRIVLLRREGRDRHARRQERVVRLEEGEKLFPHSAAHVLGRPDLGRGQVESRAEVGRHVGSEGVDPVEFGLEVGHEPVAAKDEKGVPCPGEVEIHLVHPRASGPHRRQRLAAGRLHAAVDSDPRDVAAIRPAASGEIRGAGFRPVRLGGADGRGRIGSRDRAEPVRDVLRIPCHEAGRLQVVPQVGGRHRRDEPRRGAQPRDAAEGGGDPQRTAEIGALRERDHPRCERDRAAPGGPPRADGRVPRVPGHAEHLVPCVAARRELRRVRLPEDHRAGLAQAAHDERILRGHVVREQRRAVRRAEVRRLGHILDADDEPGEGSRILTGREGGVDGGRIHLRLGIQRDDRVELPVVPFDAGQAGAEQIGRGQVARADAPGLLPGRQQSRIAVFRHDRRVSPAPAPMAGTSGRSPPRSGRNRRGARSSGARPPRRSRRSSRGRTASPSPSPCGSDSAAPSGPCG